MTDPIEFIHAVNELRQGERGGVSPPVLRRIYRGADAAPLA